MEYIKPITYYHLNSGDHGVLGKLPDVVQGEGVIFDQSIAHYLQLVLARRDVGCVQVVPDVEHVVGSVKGVADQTQGCLGIEGLGIDDVQGRVAPGKHSGSCCKCTFCVVSFLAIP